VFPWKRVLEWYDTVTLIDGRLADNSSAGHDMLNELVFEGLFVCYHPELMAGV